MGNKVKQINRKEEKWFKCIVINIDIRILYLLNINFLRVKVIS